MKKNNRNGKARDLRPQEMQRSRGGMYAIPTVLLAIAACIACNSCRSGGDKKKEEDDKKDSNTWLDNMKDAATPGCWDGPGGGFGDMPL